MAHRRMERRREEEADPRFSEAAFDDGRRSGDPDAERLEHIGAAALARNRAVAVLRDAETRARQHQRDRRGDVEGTGTVAAGAAGVEHVVEPPGERHRVRPHRARQADDFRGALAFHREADEQRRDLRLGRAAFHDLGHRGRGLLAREVLAPHQLLDECGKHRAYPRRSTKLRRMRRPSPVRIDSGWNWTPCTGSVRWRRPMIVPSSFVRAVTSSTAGSPCSATTRE